MDIGTVERGIVVRVDGEGHLTIQHAGLTPVEIMGLLSMAQAYLMDDLQLRERKQTGDEALVKALKKMKG